MIDKSGASARVRPPHERPHHRTEPRKQDVGRDVMARAALSTLVTSKTSNASSVQFPFVGNVSEVPAPCHVLDIAWCNSKSGPLFARVRISEKA